jgi:hypothetical protein
MTDKKHNKTNEELQLAKDVWDCYEKIQNGIDVEYNTNLFNSLRARIKEILNEHDKNENKTCY